MCFLGHLPQPGWDLSGGCPPASEGPANVPGRKVAPSLSPPVPSCRHCCGRCRHCGTGCARRTKPAPAPPPRGCCRCTGASAAPASSCCAQPLLVPLTRSLSWVGGCPGNHSPFHSPFPAPAPEPGPGSEGQGDWQADSCPLDHQGSLWAVPHLDRAELTQTSVPTFWRMSEDISPVS